MKRKGVDFFSALEEDEHHKKGNISPRDGKHVCVDVQYESQLYQRCKVLATAWQVAWDQKEDQTTDKHKMLVRVPLEADFSLFEAYKRNEYPNYKSDFDYLVSFLSLTDQLQDEGTFGFLIKNEFTKRLALDLADESEKLTFELLKQNAMKYTAYKGYRYQPRADVDVKKVKEIARLAYQWNLLPYLWKAIRILKHTPSVLISDIWQGMPEGSKDLYCDAMIARMRKADPIYSVFYPGEIITASEKPHQMEGYVTGQTLAIVTRVKCDQAFELVYLDPLTTRSRSNFYHQYRTLTFKAILHLTIETHSMLEKIRVGEFRVLVEKNVYESRGVNEE